MSERQMAQAIAILLLTNALLGMLAFALIGMYAAGWLR